jgi:Fur family ferric uptake transcriptional regulator
MRSIRKLNEGTGRFLQTKQRRLLLEIIQKKTGHLDARELFKEAASKDSSISLATVYRSLNLFKQMGIIEERRLGKARCYYEIKQPPQHQHLVCKECGAVIEFDCPLGRSGQARKGICSNQGRNIP